MIEMTFAISAILASFAIGPAVVPVRAGLRQFGASHVRRYQTSVTLGLCVGMCATIALAPSAGLDPVTLAVLCLLALLGACDLAWRWLPPVWSGLLGALAFADLDCIAQVGPKLLDAAIVALFLIAIRQTFLSLRRVEALGLGDVWLAAAVTLHLGLLPSFQALGLAALLGVGTDLALSVVSPRRKRRLGVAFGTHICLLSAIFISYATKNPAFPYPCAQ